LLPPKKLLRIGRLWLGVKLAPPLGDIFGDTVAGKCYSGSAFISFDLHPGGATLLICMYDAEVWGNEAIKPQLEYNLTAVRQRPLLLECVKQLSLPT
jgi:hypothetical protein